MVTETDTEGNTDSSEDEFEAADFDDLCGDLESFESD